MTFTVGETVVYPHHGAALIEEIIQRDFGDRVDRARARFKYTVDEKGVDWIKAEIGSASS